MVIGAFAPVWLLNLKIHVLAIALLFGKYRFKFKFSIVGEYLQ